MNLKLPISSSSDSESWTDLVLKLRECLFVSFEGQVEAFKEDIAKSDSQGALPGWNYCQYFLLKESFAYLYETMNLPDLSLLIYDELEDKYSQLTMNPPAVWFKIFGGLDESDDSADVLNIRRKPYRDLIMTNDVTMFDFRVYLFARQVCVALAVSL